MPRFICEIVSILLVSVVPVSDPSNPDKRIPSENSGHEQQNHAPVDMWFFVADELRAGGDQCPKS
jgi:hypothetical protein